MINNDLSKVTVKSNKKIAVVSLKLFDQKALIRLQFHSYNNMNLLSCLIYIIKKDLV